MEVGQSDNLGTLAVIQARMTSSRLPGKVLLPLPFPHGEPLIYHIVKKLQICKAIDHIVVVTSTGAKQNPLVNFLNSKNIDVIEGDEMDVLSRFIKAIEHYKPLNVVRLTADNPFLDIEKLNHVIEKHRENKADYTSTEGLPYGMNMEVASAKALLTISKLTNLTSDDREHVTVKLRNNNSFQSQFIKSEIDLSNIRVTVDTSQDYMRAALMCQIQPKNFVEKDLEFVTSCFNNYPYLFI
jgi:spore coat polysaccharide biosynthesis protein SpsF